MGIKGTTEIRDALVTRGPMEITINTVRTTEMDISPTSNLHKIHITGVVGSVRTTTRDITTTTLAATNSMGTMLTTFLDTTITTILETMASN